MPELENPYEFNLVFIIPTRFAGRRGGGPPFDAAKVFDQSHANPIMPPTPPPPIACEHAPDFNLSRSLL